MKLTGGVPLSTTCFTDVTGTGQTFWYTVKAQDTSANLSPPAEFVSASDPLSISLMSPSDGDTVEGNQFILGTAAGSQLKSWTVKVWPQGRPTQATVLSSSTHPVIKGILTFWDISTQEHGPAVIELSVSGTNGQIVHVRRTVHVGRSTVLTRLAAANSMAEFAPMPSPSERPSVR